MSSMVHYGHISVFIQSFCLNNNQTLAKYVNLDILVTYNDQLKLVHILCNENNIVNKL